MVIDVHDERNQWVRQSRAIHSLNGVCIGLAIPSGAGVIVHPDSTIDPLRPPVHEFRFESTGVTRSPLSAGLGN